MYFALRTQLRLEESQFKCSRAICGQIWVPDTYGGSWEAASSCHFTLRHPRLPPQTALYPGCRLAWVSRPGLQATEADWEAESTHQCALYDAGRGRKGTQGGRKGACKSSVEDRNAPEERGAAFVCESLTDTQISHASLCKHPSNWVGKTLLVKRESLVYP